LATLSQEGEKRRGRLSSPRYALKGERRGGGRLSSPLLLFSVPGCFLRRVSSLLFSSFLRIILRGEEKRRVL